MAQPTIKGIEYIELDACTHVIRESFSTVAKEYRLTRQNCPANGAFIETPHLVADRNKGNLMFGLYCGKILTGFMELELKKPDIYELEKLAILPEYRHLGYGSLLLSYARQIALDNHISKISLGMIEENTLLKNWYIKHGFKHIGTQNFNHLPFKVGFMEQTI